MLTIIYGMTSFEDVYCISKQLSQLIIQNEAFENGDAEAFPPDLTPSAMDVMKSSERLVEAGRSLCLTSVDQVLCLPNLFTSIKTLYTEVNFLCLNNI